MNNTLGILVMLYSQSYLGQVGGVLNNLDSLVGEINRLRKARGRDAEEVEGELQIISEYRYVQYLSDAIDKLGFLYFARDKLKESKHVATSKYYIFNFIFDCKAFLDTISGLINYHWELGKIKGDIDLSKPEFVRSLSSKSMALSTAIQNLQEWVKWIHKWRLNLIHRQGLFMYNARLMPSWSEPDEFSQAMFHKRPACDSLEVCEESIRNAKSLMETVCGYVRDDLSKR
jgi:hypothetical protein